MVQRLPRAGEGAAGDRGFVCGDAESGPATVVEAIASGRRAAASVQRLLTGADLAEQATSGAGCELLEVDVECVVRTTVVLGERPAEASGASAGPAAPRLTDLADEARRCLNCSCLAVSPSTWRRRS